MTWQSFKQAWLIRFWSPVPAVIAAGILSTYYFGITGTFWAVTGEFTRWGGQLLQLLGVHSEEAAMVGDRMDTDVIAGMESGLATVLVLSGCTSRTDVNGYPYRPTYILNGVGEIVTG